MIADCRLDSNTILTRCSEKRGEFCSSFNYSFVTFTAALSLQTEDAGKGC
jgi:hypothetical protein